MRVKYKIWLEDGDRIFSDGLALLLKTIDDEGSINRAAQQLNMSYRQAWGHVKKAEQRLGFALLDKKVGGEAGGGAELTDSARGFMQKYLQFRSEVHDAITQIFKRNFT